MAFSREYREKTVRLLAAAYLDSLEKGAEEPDLRPALTFRDLLDAESPDAEVLRQLVSELRSIDGGTPSYELRLLGEAWAHELGIEL